MFFKREQGSKALDAITYILPKTSGYITKEFGKETWPS